MSHLLYLLLSIDLLVVRLDLHLAVTIVVLLIVNADATKQLLCILHSLLSLLLDLALLLLLLQLVLVPLEELVVAFLNLLVVFA